MSIIDLKTMLVGRWRIFLIELDQDIGFSSRLRSFVARCLSRGLNTACDANVGCRAQDPKEMLGSM